MDLRDAQDVLADAACTVVDGESLRRWVEGPLRAALPHRALFCGQSVFHAGGYTAVRRWSFGLSPAYEASITCAGGNVRSPVLHQLLTTNVPVYFHAFAPTSRPIDPGWRKNFVKAGWTNLLGLMARSATAPDYLLTTAAFYDVRLGAQADLEALQAIVMPVLEQACLCAAVQPSPAHDSSGPIDDVLTHAEQAVVDLLALGMSNKEIAQTLGKSLETVKKQVQSAMRRLGASNRTMLAKLASSVRREG